MKNYISEIKIWSAAHSARCLDANEDCHYFHPKPRIEQDAGCSVGTGDINDSCVLNVNRGISGKMRKLSGSGLIGLRDWLGCQNQ